MNYPDKVDKALRLLDMTRYWPKGHPTRDALFDGCAMLLADGPVPAPILPNINEESLNLWLS